MCVFIKMLHRFAHSYRYNTQVSSYYSGSGYKTYIHISGGSAIHL